MSPCHWAGHWAVPAPGPLTAPARGAQRLRHTAVSHTARGALRAHFKMEHLFCHSSHHLPELQCSLLIQTCKSRTITSCQSLGNSWHSQDFAESGHSSLPPASNMMSHRLSELSPQNTNSPSSLSDHKKQLPKINHGLSFYLWKISLYQRLVFFSKLLLYAISSPDLFSRGFWSNFLFLPVHASLLSITSAERTPLFQYISVFHFTQY